MKRNIIAASVLLMITVFVVTGCLSEKGSPIPNEKAPPRTALQQTDPKQVADAFIRAQASNDRKTLATLMSPDLKKMFEDKDLYLFSKEELKGKEVTLNNIEINEEDTGKEDARLYTVEYEITIDAGGTKEQRQIIDLVFVSKNEESGKWFVTTYQHILFQ